MEIINAINNFLWESHGSALDLMKIIVIFFLLAAYLYLCNRLVHAENKGSFLVLTGVAVWYVVTASVVILNYYHGVDLGLW